MRTEKKRRVGQGASTVFTAPGLREAVMEFVEPTCKQLTRAGERCHSAFKYQRQQRPHRVALASDCSKYCALHCPKWIARFLTALPTHAYFRASQQQFPFTTAIVASIRPFKQGELPEELSYGSVDLPHTTTKVTLKRQDGGQWTLSEPTTDPEEAHAIVCGLFQRYGNLTVTLSTDCVNPNTGGEEFVVHPQVGVRLRWETDLSYCSFEPDSDNNTLFWAHGVLGTLPG